MITVSMSALPTALLCALFAVAIYTDMASSKIPNILTLPALLLGMVLAALEGGLSGLAQSIGGAAAVLVLFLLFAPLAGVGGGDTKLMMAVGAIVGIKITLWALLFSAIVGGVLSLVVMARHRVLLSTTKQMATNTYLRFLTRTPVDITTGSSKIKFRYSPAIALGTLLAVFLAR